MRNIFLLVICITVLSACAQRKAPKIYTLKPVAAAKTSGCKLNSSIKILEPNAAPGMEGAAIVVLQDGTQTRFRGVAWNGTAPRVIQAYFADAFEASGKFPNVSTDNDRIKSSQLLETRLRGIFVDRSAGKNDAVIQLTVALLDAGDRKTITSLPLERRTDVSGKKMEEVAGVFNEQMASISAEVLSHLTKTTVCRK